MKCKNAYPLHKSCSNGLSMAIRCEKGIANCIRACSPKCKGYQPDIAYSMSVKGNGVDVSAKPYIAQAQSEGDKGYLNNNQNRRSCCGGQKKGGD